MKLFWRDDDISYFTSPREIEDAFSFAWKKGPISVGVIPYDVETFHRGNLNSFSQNLARTYPIGDNSELCSFIREALGKRKLYLMLHGFNHYYDFSDREKNPSGIPEFVYCQDGYDRIRKGKDYLEDLFNQKIDWFIPPSNSLSYQNLNAVKKHGLNIPYVYPLRSRISNVSDFLNLIILKSSHLMKRADPVFIKNSWEVPCLSITSSRNDWHKIRDMLPRVNPVIATHYWEINQDRILRESLEKLIELTDEILPFGAIG